MRHSVQVLEHLRLWFICLFLLFLHLHPFICNCTCVWLVILTYTSQREKCCTTDLNVLRRRNVKILFHIAMTFLARSAFINRGLRLLEAGLLLHDFFLHSFASTQLENLHHYSNLYNNVEFNMIWHT